MVFKERLKDVGRQMMGQGPEVRFKGDVAEYAKTHGVSREAAEKAVFQQRVGELQHEFTLLGSTGARLESFRHFQAGLNEMFKSDDLGRFRKDSGDPTIFRNLILAPHAPADVAKMEAYYRRHFEGKTPSMAVVRDSTDNLRLLKALLTRFSTDPRLARSADLKTEILNHPEFGADIGMILLAQEAFAKKERRFGRELAFEKSKERLGRDMKESLAVMLWKAPVDWFRESFKGGIRDPYKLFGQMFGSTMNLLIKEAGAGSKLLLSAAETAGRYLNKRRE